MKLGRIYMEKRHAAFSDSGDNAFVDLEAEEENKRALVSAGLASNEEFEIPQVTAGPSAAAPAQQYS